MIYNGYSSARNRDWQRLAACPMHHMFTWRWNYVQNEHLIDDATIGNETTLARMPFGKCHSVN